jgi:hypothetical protein
LTLEDHAFVFDVNERNRLKESATGLSSAEPIARVVVAGSAQHAGEEYHTNRDRSAQRAPAMQSQLAGSNNAISL